MAELQVTIITDMPQKYGEQHFKYSRTTNISTQKKKIKKLSLSNSII
jgi:hypothetical protein